MECALPRQSSPLSHPQTFSHNPCAPKDWWVSFTSFSELPPAAVFQTRVAFSTEGTPFSFFFQFLKFYLFIPIRFFALVFPLMVVNKFLRFFFQCFVRQFLTVGEVFFLRGTSNLPFFFSTCCDFSSSVCRLVFHFFSLNKFPLLATEVSIPLFSFLNPRWGGWFFCFASIHARKIW